MRKNNLLSLIALAMITMFTFSCQNEEKTAVENEIPESVLTAIHNAGFSKDNVQKVDGGYLVEGDILLHNADLNKPANGVALRIADVEQYRTTNLVSSLPRTITVGISSYLPSSYVSALDEAIRRYNAEGLRVSFRRSNSGYNIWISKAPAGSSYLASAGFPSGGNPYTGVKVNSDYLGSNPGTNYLATILAHELGHCIGFRHTDYMNRQYSCGGSYYNEGASTVGAIHIPGTPTGPDSGSWMLACIGTGANRYFNSNDRTALNYVY
jgi:hypothetical protein